VARTGSTLYGNVVGIVGHQSSFDETIDHHLVHTQVSHVYARSVGAHGGGVGVCRFLTFLIGAAAVVLDILHGIADAAVGFQGVDGDITAVVVGHHECAAAGFDDQVAGRGAMGRLPIEAGQTTGCRVNGIAVNVPRLIVFAHGVENVALGMQCQKGRMLLFGSECFMPKSSGLCVEAIDVDAFTVCVCVGTYIEDTFRHCVSPGGFESIS